MKKIRQTNCRVRYDLRYNLEEISATFCASAVEDCGCVNCEREKRRKRRIWSARANGSERENGSVSERRSENRRGKRSERRRLKRNQTVSDELAQVSPLLERRRNKAKLTNPG